LLFKETRKRERDNKKKTSSNAALSQNLDPSQIIIISDNLKETKWKRENSHFQLRSKTDEKRFFDFYSREEVVFWQTGSDSI
jgi:hypothetical protein